MAGSVYRAVKAAGGGLAESDRARVAMLQANVDGRSIEEATTLAIFAAMTESVRSPTRGTPA